MIGAFQPHAFQIAYQQQSGQPYPPPAGARRKRYLVEIDGQSFEVENPDHAQAILDQARTLAQNAAAIQAQRVISERIDRRTPRDAPIRIAVPQITTQDVELQPMVSQMRAQLAKIYQDAARNAEIRLRLERQQLADDDDDIVMLL